MQKYGQNDGHEENGLLVVHAVKVQRQPLVQEVDFQAVAPRKVQRRKQNFARKAPARADTLKEAGEQQAERGRKQQRGVAVEPGLHSLARQIPNSESTDRP